MPPDQISGWGQVGSDVAKTVGDMKTRLDELEKKGFKKGYDKPIMEHRIWDSVSKLSSNRTGFQNWKLGFKNAMKQCSKSEHFRDILDFIEGSKSS